MRRMSVPEQSLHGVKRYTLVDQKTRERVPQIMQPHVRQTGPLTGALERVEHLWRCALFIGGKMYGLPLMRFSPRSNANAASLRATVLGLPDFESGTSRVAFRPVHILPLGSQDLIALCACKQQRDGVRCWSVLLHRDGGNQALGYLRCQKPLAVDFGTG